MSAHHTLEHAEHIGHSGHSGERLGLMIGVTMAVLGVLLAICSAQVGSERTLLIEKLVEQQNAHAKYQAQDVKHRMAYLALVQVHASAFVSQPPMVKKEAVMQMANTVERYLAESVLAREWTNAYDKEIKAHMTAQEEFEHALLLAEIGIVIASIALLMRRKEAWYLSLLLGAACIFIVIKTQLHVNHEVAASTNVIADARTKYETARKQNKTTAEEEQLVKSMKAWASAP